MKWAIVVIAALIVPSSPAAVRAEEVLPRLVGSWSVKYDNGIEGYTTLNKDLTATVWEPRRQAAGKIEVRDGQVVVVNDDGRLERWTPVGRRAVVEHWAKAADYPGKPTVVGIAEVVRDNRAEEYRPDSSQPGGFRREAIGMLLAKGFVDALRKPLSDETAAELRQYIDPAYLKQHKLEDGAFPIRRVVTGSIFAKSRVDPQTIFMLVETADAEKEIWLLRITETDGKAFILPPLPPDPDTKAFKAWTFRWKL